MQNQIVQESRNNIGRENEHLMFGDFLVNKGLLSRDQLVEALNEQRDKSGRLGEILISLNMLSDSRVAEALAEYLSIEYISLDDMGSINKDVARTIPESIAKRFCLICIGEMDNKIVVAMADPLNVVAIDTITLKSKRQVKVVLSSPAKIKQAIDVVFHGSDIEEQELRDLVETDISDEDLTIEEIAEDDSENELEATKAPVIRFVDLLLSQATKSKASDIHIEPQERTMSIRMRVDGRLREMVPPPRRMQSGVIARLKILAKLDIAERRLPQDGRLKIKASGRAIDVRVSTIPTIYGEKVVMRILDTSSVNHDIDHIGFEPDLLKKFKAILEQPHGIVIVTGPTGSGKSTTLYSALQYLKDPTINITTVEDPVEYRLAGINQVQVKSEIELTFAACLRSILRQDPDIVLIGEIRDKETVEIAIQAALTGHMVLSTFHTNDAPSAISRLTFMGLERYLLASTLNLIIAQRLVRKICEKCKEPTELKEEIIKRLQLSEEDVREGNFCKGKGCTSCGGTGYSGRLPVFEFLILDNDIRQAIVAEASEAEIRDIARSKGFGGIQVSGISKMKQGLTTAEEILKVAYAEKIE